MCETTIVIKNNISDELLAELTKLANLKHNNRLGKTENCSADKRKLIFRTENRKNRLSIILGDSELYNEKSFRQYVERWNYVDEEEPSNSCDVIKVFSSVDARNYGRI